MLYTIEDKTLTAMGDAVRSYTGKYTTVDTSTEGHFYELEYDTRDYESDGMDYNKTGYFWRYYIDLSTILGDKRDLTKYCYVEWDYEVVGSKIGSGMTTKVLSHLEFNPSLPWDDNSSVGGGLSLQLINASTATTGNNTGYWNVNRINYPYLTIKIGKYPYEAGDAYVKVKFKLWACDADKKFVELKKYTPLEMVDEVYGIIDDFANAPIIPEEAFTITGNCDYRFSNNGWNWFIENNGDKLTTKDISTLKYMFYYSNSLEEIPFNINITKSSTNYESVFYYCNKLKSLPYIIGPERTPPTSAYSGTLSLSNMFSYCSNIRTIPYDFFWKMIPNKDFWDKNATLTPQNHTYIFNGCYSLRELPDISMLGGAWTSGYSCLYYYIFNSCYSLDKIENLPVCGKFTSNAFINTFDNCYRLKELTFAVNEDGTPKTANWKSQTINTKMFGYMVSSNENIWLGYNHGITKDKKVFDDASYQLLKDDPDYYTTNERYSLYNHDAAVRTINSLPDCSATGTNTIHFKGNYGEYTDGGAINTLTEEEIAVAVAKGWTVSLS